MKTEIDQNGSKTQDLGRLGQAPRILIVDDEPLILEGLSGLLKPKGYEVTTALGGRDALSAIFRQQFDLILLDLCMPDLGGAEVLRFLADRSVDTPVIVVSGDASIESAIRALRGGATDFIRKPYEPDELLRRIYNTLDKRRLERENSLILQRLQQSEKWHRFLVNSSPDFIYTLDQDGCFTFSNERVENLLGYGKEELIGLHYTCLILDEDMARAEHVFNDRRTSERSTRNVELRLKFNPGHRRPRIMNGRYRTVELNATGMYEQTDNKFETRFMGTYGVAKDISDRKQAEETVYYQAYHDLLTGLPNRALFRDYLGLALAQSKRNHQTMAILILDLDHFKIVNDTLGHGYGDELLINMSSRLRACLREGDTLARLGGDEFGLLVPGVLTYDDVEQIGRKIINTLSKPLQIKGNELYVSVSIGACMAPSDGDMLDMLIRQAEIAMYQAKTQGRARLEFWQPGMQAPYSTRLQVEADLRRALARNEFVLFYQPIVDIATGAIRGFEALLRWMHPEHGLLSPAEFIPIAEETGVIVPIGEWVLRAASAQMAEWKEAKLSVVRMSVNISPRQLENPDFVDSVMRSMQIHAVESEFMELEITESLLMRDLEGNALKLGRLASNGVKIAVDDFGTGYSSFKYLSKFPIHTLKIDQSFIKELIPNEHSPIVNAIVGMGKGLNLNVVAEGVETEDQLDILRSLDCSEMQGFLFSAPVSSFDATRMLEDMGGIDRSIGAIAGA